MSRFFFTFLCFRRCNDGGLVPEEEGGRNFWMLNLYLIKMKGAQKGQKDEKYKDLKLEVQFSLFSTSALLKPNSI